MFHIMGECRGSHLSIKTHQMLSLVGAESIARRFPGIQTDEWLFLSALLKVVRKSIHRGKLASSNTRYSPGTGIGAERGL